MAKGNGGECAKGKTEVITKTVKLPLVVTMTGSKAKLLECGEDLTEKLRQSLPITMRLGRGAREVISVDLKAQ